MSDDTHTLSEILQLSIQVPESSIYNDELITRDGHGGQQKASGSLMTI